MIKIWDGYIFVILVLKHRAKTGEELKAEGK